ncbi:MAG: hypothetical protein V3T60_11190 [Candidatus Binatia bacterium]
MASMGGVRINFTTGDVVKELEPQVSPYLEKRPLVRPSITVTCEFISDRD